MTSCKACKTYEDDAVGAHSRRVAHDLAYGQRPQQSSGGLAEAVGDPGKSKKTKEKGKAEHHDAFSLLFDCLDKVGKPTERNRQRPAVKLAGQLGKTERYGIMGT